MTLHKRNATSEIEMQPKDIRPSSSDDRPSADLEHQNYEGAHLQGGAGPSQPYYSQYSGRTR